MGSIEDDVPCDLPGDLPCDLSGDHQFLRPPWAWQQVQPLVMPLVLEQPLVVGQPLIRRGPRSGNVEIQISAPKRKKPDPWKIPIMTEGLLLDESDTEDELHPMNLPDQSCRPKLVTKECELQDNIDKVQDLRVLSDLKIDELVQSLHDELVHPSDIRNLQWSLDLQRKQKEWLWYFRGKLIRKMWKVRKKIRYLDLQTQYCSAKDTVDTLECQIYELQIEQETKVGHLVTYLLKIPQEPYLPQDIVDSTQCVTVSQLMNYCDAIQVEYSKRLVEKNQMLEDSRSMLAESKKQFFLLKDERIRRMEFQRIQNRNRQLADEELKPQTWIKAEQKRILMQETGKQTIQVDANTLYTDDDPWLCWFRDKDAPEPEWVVCNNHIASGKTIHKPLIRNERTEESFYQQEPIVPNLHPLDDEGVVLVDCVTRPSRLERIAMNRQRQIDARNALWKRSAIETPEEKLAREFISQQRANFRQEFLAKLSMQEQIARYEAYNRDFKMTKAQTHAARKTSGPHQTSRTSFQS